MTNSKFTLLLLALLTMPVAARAQSADACKNLTGFNLKGVEITKSEHVPAGTTIRPPIPAHLRSVPSRRIAAWTA